MNVLLIGSGGRESALAHKISQSTTLSKLYIAPGNPGTEKYGENVSIEITDYDAVSDFCKEKEIELIVVGPEQPLVDGIADYLSNKDFKVFGPDSKAAEIEAHKSYSKGLMKKYNIPTADYVEFDYTQQEEALNYLRHISYPCVIKADGLAAGKGVLICNNFPEVSSAIEEVFVHKVFGASGEKIIVEEFMKGEELSIFAITDGKDFVCLPSSQDHKRIGDNDTGKNTGGMGAYSPAPIATKELLKEIENQIISPTINALDKEGRKFVGCLYVGLMITDNGPKVVEFNCRFGDPETQAVLPLIDGNFLELLYSAASGKIDKNAINNSSGCAVCVVAASKGYPEEYQKGYTITGLDLVDNNETFVYQAGTAKKNGYIVTNGGRVLGVTAVVEGNDLKSAQSKAYEALKKIHFTDIYYRSDIGAKALRK